MDHDHDTNNSDNDYRSEDFDGDRNSKKVGG